MRPAGALGHHSSANAASGKRRGRSGHKVLLNLRWEHIGLTTAEVRIAGSAAVTGRVLADAPSVIREQLAEAADIFADAIRAG
jgi:hypothetical protein